MVGDDDRHAPVARVRREEDTRIAGAVRFDRMPRVDDQIDEGDAEPISASVVV